MALETVVYNHQDILYNNDKDPYNLFAGGYWGCDFDNNSFDFLQENSPPSQIFVFPSSEQYWDSPNASSSELQIPNQEISHDHQHPQRNSEEDNTTVMTRFKRRRSRPKKNQQEIEHQRMAHIAIERNRRKQMNEYLSVLRGLMPEGYAHKGDQASIVGGAINYVKELEQQLQFLDGQNHESGSSSSSSSSSPFSDFLTYPQYSTSLTSFQNGFAMRNDPSNGGKPPLAAADIEVTMVESHANLKVKSKRKPKQLMKMVYGLQGLKLTILHLNVTTASQTVLYSLSLKVEDDCKLSSADEIAAAVNQIFSRVQEEAAAAAGLIG